MILRILLLCAAVFASKEPSNTSKEYAKQAEEKTTVKPADKEVQPKIDGCMIPVLVGGLSVVGACFAYCWYQYELGLEKQYNQSPMNQPIVIPANYNILWNNGATPPMTCLQVLNTGFTVAAMAAVKQAGAKAWKNLKCVDNVIPMLNKCVYGKHNDPTGLDKTKCTKELAVEVRGLNDMLYKAIDMRDAEKNRSAEYPTGFKIVYGGLPNGLTFKTPCSTSRSGCLDPVTTPYFETNQCGEHAVVELLPTNIDFWEMTELNVKLPKVEKYLKQALKKSDAKQYSSNLKIQSGPSNWFANAMNYFKYSSFKISIGGSEKIEVKVQYINGADWYKGCKSSFWTDHTEPSPSWSNKCSLSEWYPTYTGNMPVAVSIESIDGTTKTYFRSHATYDNGFFSTQHTTKVYECTNAFDWSGKPETGDGCALVLTGVGTDDESSAMLKVVKQEGVDLSALFAYHLSEFFTNKVQREYESLYNSDYQEYQNYLARKEQRRKDRERFNKR